MPFPEFAQFHGNCACPAFVHASSCSAWRWCLPVVLIAIVLSLRMSGASVRNKVPLLPWFMVMFVALSLLKSVTDLPDALLGAV